MISKNKKLGLLLGVAALSLTSGAMASVNVEFGVPLYVQFFLSQGTADTQYTVTVLPQTNSPKYGVIYQTAKNGLLITGPTGTNARLWVSDYTPWPTYNLGYNVTIGNHSTIIDTIVVQTDPNTGLITNTISSQIGWSPDQQANCEVSLTPASSTANAILMFVCGDAFPKKISDPVLTK